MSTIFKHVVSVAPLTNGVEIESVSFNGSSKPAGAQVWGLDIMEGWKTSGDVEEASTELGSYRDGVSAASFFPVRKRYITVGGYALAATEAQAEALHDVLVRDAFPRNKSILLYRNEAVAKMVYARRSAAFEVDWTAVHNGFRWQTTLMCEDPLKYSTFPAQAIGGIAGILTGGHTFPVTFPHTFNSGSSGQYATIGITNAGTAYSQNFTATLKGYLGRGAWRLANDTTGDYITIDTAVQTTDGLVLDFRNQVATLNGYPVSTSYTGTWWKLAPGLNAIRLYAEYDANALVTLSYRSAWE